MSKAWRLSFAVMVVLSRLVIIFTTGLCFFSAAAIFIFVLEIIFAVPIACPLLTRSKVASASFSITAIKDWWSCSLDNDNESFCDAELHWRALTKSYLVLRVSWRASLKHACNPSTTSFDFDSFFVIEQFSDNVTWFCSCASQQVLLTMLSVRMISSLVTFRPVFDGNISCCLCCSVLSLVGLSGGV